MEDFLSKQGPNTDLLSLVMSVLLSDSILVSFADLWERGEEEEEDIFFLSRKITSNFFSNSKKNKGYLFTVSPIRHTE